MPVLMIPGIDVLSGRIILSEIGRDMEPVPDPGTSAVLGRTVSTQTMRVPGSAVPPRLRKGDPWLKTLLVQCAWAARREKGSYFKAQLYRLSGRRGPKPAR
jgi:transposase